MLHILKVGPSAILTLNNQEYNFFMAVTVLTKINLLFAIDNVNVGFPCGSAGKESACNVGDLGSIPRLGRSPQEGKGYLL